MKRISERTLLSSKSPLAQAVARDVLIAEVEAWACQIGFANRIRKIHIRPMKNKWASISTRGMSTLNAELASQLASFRREVIVHKLVPLKLDHGSHNGLFRALAKAYFAQVSFKSMAEAK